MKIYTKRGDTGSTSLANGQIVSKHNPRIESIGTIDELNSWIGLLSDEIQYPQTKLTLLQVQKTLFHINSIIALWATTLDAKPNAITNETLNIEHHIDTMQQDLPALAHFILYGGHIVLSHIHITRSVCRRAERTLCVIESLPPEIQAYFNRLSDYLFVLARWMGMQLKLPEKYWVP